MNVDLRNMDSDFIEAVEEFKKSTNYSTNSKAVIAMVKNYNNLKNEIQEKKEELSNLRESHWNISAKIENFKDIFNELLK
ncbi:MAG: hypothetical protein HC854_17690 [Flavobacterium sp.]|nr:hypothetical protein [Flavobacterium sp.]